jgi:peptide/nickel transport system permease protein
MDRITTVIASAMISAPSFLTAMVLSYLFAVRWKVLPVTGWVPLTENPIENLRHAILPVLSMATLEIAVFIRLLRSDMISTLREDFVLAARSTGLPRWRILFQYALRPSSFSLVTLAGIVLGRLIAGTVIVETIFALPGIGQYVVSAIYNKDVVVVQGVLLFVAVSYVVINALVDLSYQWLDPRVRAREVSS